MLKYMEVPEFIEGNKALNEIVEAAEKFKSTKSHAVSSIVTVVKKMRGQLNEATKKLEDARAKLVSEEIHKGKSTASTAKITDEAYEEVNRIKATMEAVSRMGGLAIVEMERKLQSLKVSSDEINGMIRAIYDTPHTHLDGGRRKKDLLLKEENKKLTQVQNEIDEVSITLEILKEHQSKYGTLIIADSGTIEAAKACVEIAARAWNTRFKMSQDLISKIELNENEIQRLQEENITLSEALMATNPDSAGDYIYASEIGLILWPELWNEIGSSSYIKNAIRMNVKHLAQSLDPTVVVEQKA
jgi:hypothetical protein